MASNWISYNDLAWTEDWLADPEQIKDEVIVYIDLIKANCISPASTLLHLGCGAGNYDTFFKQHFTITGVDLSNGMLEKARKKNPDIEYIEGDMKTIQLNRQFDVVVIPDGIGYLVSEDDLSQAISNAAYHLKTGGILIVAANIQETFQNNNFVYTGEKEGISITLFENNYINTFKPNTYEATIAYLIRNKGELSIYTENQILGLFSQTIWENIFKKAGLNIQTTTLSDVYEKYILNDGEYPITVFIGRK